MTIPDHLRIRLGSAHDAFWLEGATVNGSGDIETRGDFIESRNSRFDGKLHLRTGAGADLVLLRDSVFAASVDIETGNGDDRLGILRCSFDSSVAIDTGVGNDRIVIEEQPPDVFLGSVAIHTGAGDDTIFILAEGDFSARPLFVAPLLIDGGPGFDTLNHDFVAAASLLAPFLTIQDIESS